MDIRSKIEKVVRAPMKRARHKKEKSREQWLALGYENTPEVSFIIESHNASASVATIVKRLRSLAHAEIIVIDDGSNLRHTKSLTKLMGGGDEFVIRANDLYENVMYDKAIRFSNGRYVVLLQDDDDLGDLEWVNRGLFYFRKYPDMAILGGFGGFTFEDDGEKCRSIPIPIETIKEKEFMFVHSVNRAPMIIDRILFDKYLKHIDFSFAPFQYDDTELCLRAWLSGLKVGWYNAGFTSLVAGGMRIWNNKFTQVQAERNSRLLHKMYGNLVAELNQLVSCAQEGCTKDRR